MTGCQFASYAAERCQYYWVNCDIAEAEAVDRNTSVRSVMALPAYRSTTETAQVLGRKAEGDSIATILEMPAAKDEEATREDEMDALYQIRLSRRHQLTEREERRNARREGRAMLPDKLPTKSVWESPREAEHRTAEQMDLVLVGSVQNNYALGLVGVESDLERLDLADSTWPPPDSNLKGTSRAVQGDNPQVLPEQRLSTRERQEDVIQLDIKTPPDCRSVLSQTYDSLTNELMGGIPSNVTSGHETDESWYSDSETGSESLASEDRLGRPVDHSARVLRILHQNKARVVRQIVQHFRKLIGSRKSQTQGLRDEGGGVKGEGSSSQHGSNSGQSGGDGSKRAFSNLNGEGNQEEENSRGGGNDKRRPAKRPRMSGQGQETVAEGLKLACPYFKRNPMGPMVGQSCGGPGWHTIHRLKYVPRPIEINAWVVY